MPSTLRLLTAPLSAIVTVTPVASLALAPPSGSVAVGATLQLTPTVLDASSHVLTGRVVTYASSAPSTATVSSTGLVTGIAAGSATITATCEGVSVTMAMTVGAVGAGAFSDTRRFAPANPVPTGYAYSSTTGFVERTEAAWDTLPGQGTSTIDPAAYTDVVRLTGAGATNAAMQAAINAAALRSTHTLILCDAVDYGYIDRPGRTAGGWVVAADKRVDPASPTPYPYPFNQPIPKSAAGTLPRYQSTSDSPVLTFQDGCRRYGMVGFECTFAPGWDTGAFTVGGRRANNLGFIFYAGAGATLPAYPTDVVFRHGLIHGVLGKACKRGAHFAAKGVCWEGCNFYDMGEMTQDAQCLYQSKGPGPYRIVHNNFELGGGGENILFGGDSSNGADRTHMIGQVMVDGNTFAHPQDWQDLGGENKNHIEFKVGDTGVVQRNHFMRAHLTGSFAQQYFSVVAKLQAETVSEQAWSETRYLTIRGNRGQDNYNFLSVSGTIYPLGVHDIEVSHNVWEQATTLDPNARAWVIQFGGFNVAPNLKIHHNTVLLASNPGSGQVTWDLSGGTQAGSESRAGLQVFANVFILNDGVDSRGYAATVGYSGAVPWWNDINTNGVAAGSLWTHNAILTSVDYQPNMIAGDYAFASTPHPRSTLLDPTGVLVSGSPLLTFDTDGGPIGADLRLVPTHV